MVLSTFNVQRSTFKHQLIMIRWGVIGCGEATEKKSGPAFSNIEGSKIEAVMSRNAERARSYAERHGVRRSIPPCESVECDP